MGVLIGHEAYKEFKSLPEGVDVRDFNAVYDWALETGKKALADWMHWRWKEMYIRGLDEGLEPATLYFGILVPVRRGEEWGEKIYQVTDEDGRRRIVVFSFFGDARQYCLEWALLDEYPVKMRQDETGELVRPSRAWGWEPRGLPLSALKRGGPNLPIILDPPITEPGRRITVAELEEGD